MKHFIIFSIEYLLFLYTNTFLMHQCITNIQDTSIRFLFVKRTTFYTLNILICQKQRMYFKLEFYLIFGIHLGILQVTSQNTVFLML